MLITRRPGRGPLALAALVLILALTAGGPLRAQEGSKPTLLDKLDAFQMILHLVETNYVDEVEATRLIDGAIDGMLEELDPHSDFIDADRYRRMNERNRGEYFGIGISFAIREGYLTVISPIEGSPSDALGIRQGDRIVRIDGDSAIGITESEVFDRLRGAKGTTVHVSVARPGQEPLLEFDITRDKIPIKSIPYWFMLDDETGYIRMIRFSATTSDELETALDELEGLGMRQLLFDLRGNAGGYLEQAIAVSDKFIDGDKMIVYTKGRIPGASEEHHASDITTHDSFPLVVLIDHGSASASEIVSGAIQDWDRGLVVGQTSFGKGLVQRQYRLTDGSALFLTVARYYTPSGRLIQRDYQPGDKVTYYSEGYDDVDPNDPDSTLTDRPIYTTAGGRVVYGGGGITPDIRLDRQELTSAQQVLERSQIFFEFANEWAGDHAIPFDDVESFRTGFVPDAALWSAFVDKVAAKGIEIAADDVAAERDYVEFAIKRELAGNRWGAAAQYRIRIDRDAVVAAARQHFGEAQELVMADHAAQRSND